MNLDNKIQNENEKGNRRIFGNIYNSIRKYFKDLKNSDDICIRCGSYNLKEKIMVSKNTLKFIVYDICMDCGTIKKIKNSYGVNLSKKK